MVVRLECDSLHVRLAPDRGGGIAAFTSGETELMSPAGPHGLCEFPMAPFVNRIAGGVFHWEGETIRLPRNSEDGAHAIHGFGWSSAWDVVASSQTHAVLRCALPPGAVWPWTGLTMTRRFTLAPGALTVLFEMTHDDPRPMPAALGVHPYFPVRGAIVRLAAGALWRTEGDIPVARATPPLLASLRAGAAMAAHDVDHCLDAWTGGAVIAWSGHTIAIETDPPQRFVQLYAPPGRDFFCLEPQSAMPDGIGRDGGGYVRLHRGETLAFTTRFVVTRPSS